MTLLDTISLPVPVLQALDYFKQYDLYTYAHILMVFALSRLLAKDLIPDDRECIRLSATGPTHDIGKLCVPLPILRKATPLTRAEHDYLQHHSAAGYVLLGCYYKNVRHLACRVALDHHERRDGSGYPRGILLRDPIVEIIVVSDIYDALIKPRPYRSESYETRTALEEIVQMAEQNKIGWGVVRALIGHHRASKPHYSEVSLSTEKRGIPPLNNVYGILAEGGKTESKD
jgi:HD-GYP domain-containing protein (c-di-GMP phosphodiesterase class II)